MNYLDISKSMIISSPAGSGKTEKLARRYIALLRGGVDVERILAITFTDKAAAEMKQRILKLLKQNDMELFRTVLEKMPLMRVSTIHSFCGTLLRRFSYEADIDPNYSINDSIDSGTSWEEVLYEFLMDAGRGEKGNSLLRGVLSERGFRGLEYLKDIADYLYRAAPFSFVARPFLHYAAEQETLTQELRSWHGVKDVLEGYENLFNGTSGEDLALFEKYFLTDRKEPRKRAVDPLKNIAGYREWAYGMYTYWKDRKLTEYAEKTGRMQDVFRLCLERYNLKKADRGVLDFSDLEYISYRMLTENPEWANILHAFDEKTDHVLVDEFQDTNNFQWAIIDKLTEEWQSGQSAKREAGIRPTVFLVGDEKQSIYFFRGANVEIFRRAGEKLKNWLGNEFIMEEVKENYRSLPAVVEFTNHVFSKIMQTGERSFPWTTRYTEFRPQRTGESEGTVELLLLDEKEDENTAELKQREAEIIAQRITSLAGNYPVTDRTAGRQRPCEYMDMAILLRKRTHLQSYEEAFRRYDIPFVAVKGIGFYQEPEVFMLRALLLFLSNPSDDYSLYIILKSPLFNLDEHAVVRALNRDGGSLFEKLTNISPDDVALSSMKGHVQLLQEWLAQLPDTPLSEMIENVLVYTGAWKYFHEPQKRANIKKFIRIIEDMEADGRSIIRVRDFLESTYNRDDEPKANVDTEGMNAVRILTVHASKGLEFPVVFVPGLEEQFSLKRDECLVYEKNGQFFFKSIPESSIRNQDEDFQIHRAREEEEQKRLFYVAVTRAEEALFLVGQWTGRDNNFLGFLRKGLGLEKDGPAYKANAAIPGFTHSREEDVKADYAPSHEKKTAKKNHRPVEVFPLELRKQKPWKPVTETVDIRRRHGRDWVVLGDVIHRILEEISRGLIKEEDIRERARKLLRARESFNEDRLGIIEQQTTLLRKNGIWQEIIDAKNGGFAELPFVYDCGDAVYSGRIDRIIRKNAIWRIYDYKTFPVDDEDTEFLAREYALQLDIYRKAVCELFDSKDARTYIVFTHTGEVRKILQ